MKYLRYSGMLPSAFSWWSTRKSGCCLHGRCCWQLLLDCHQLLNCFPPSLPETCSCHLSWKAALRSSKAQHLGKWSSMLIDLAVGQGEQVEKVLGLCICIGGLQACGSGWLISCGALEWSCVLMQAAKQGRNLLQLSTLYGLPRVNAARVCISASQCAE